MLHWTAPIRVAFRLRLHAENGDQVHAASDLRRRLILFDRALLADRREFRRIVVHELAHFAWQRLGNPARRAWEAVLVDELERRARGELGWSAELRKLKLSPGAQAARTRRWREYVCESFCDSAAWLLTGARPHPEATLARRHRSRRVAWFVDLLRRSELQI